MAAVAWWSRLRTRGYHVMSSNLVPLKISSVGEKAMYVKSIEAQTSSSWYGTEVGRGVDRSGVVLFT
ncbi:hypothetical protein TNCV_1939541 [Trichonephila clavipes]|nr:hypothetical protein TNCV_1939541 [Trichonephila clavipes]